MQQDCDEYKKKSHFKVHSTSILHVHPCCYHCVIYFHISYHSLEHVRSVCSYHDHSDCTMGLSGIYHIFIALFLTAKILCLTLRILICSASFLMLTSIKLCPRRLQRGIGLSQAINVGVSAAYEYCDSVFMLWLKHL